MKVFVLSGRYAEDPDVYVEAESAEEAAEKALALGLPVKPGYGPDGHLTPVEVS